MNYVRFQLDLLLKLFEEDIVLAGKALLGESKQIFHDLRPKLIALGSPFQVAGVWSDLGKCRVQQKFAGSGRYGINRDL